jgi:hypothetical protein
MTFARDARSTARAAVIEGVFDDALPRIFERLAAERRTSRWPIGPPRATAIAASRLG